MKRKIIALLAGVLTASIALAQPMKPEDLEKYAKERYGDKWTEAAQNLASQLVLDKNQSLTYQQVIEMPGKTKDQIYQTLHLWATATFNDPNAITFSDKESGTLILRSTMPNIASHMGTLNRYIVNITPVMKIDIKEGRFRVTTTVQTYDVLNAAGSGWLGGTGDKDNRDYNTFADGKRMKEDKTDRMLYDEQWEIAKHFPFVEKDSRKRTSSKALIMTHAYVNAMMDRLTDTAKNGLTGNEDQDW